MKSAKFLHEEEACDDDIACIQLGGETELDKECDGDLACTQLGGETELDKACDGDLACTQLGGETELDKACDGDLACTQLGGETELDKECDGDLACTQLGGETELDKECDGDLACTQLGGETELDKACDGDLACTQLGGETELDKECDGDLACTQLGGETELDKECDGDLACTQLGGETELDKACDGDLACTQLGGETELDKACDGDLACTQLGGETELDKECDGDLAYTQLGGETELDKACDGDLACTQLGGETELDKECDGDLACTQLDCETDVVSYDCSSGITMPAILNSSVHTTKTLKKNIRVWNIFHYCLFCSYAGSNISRHLRQKHCDEEEVTDILDTDARYKKLIGKKMELLRLKGDHKHNIAVVAAKEGSIVLARRKRGEEFDIEQYGPCPECYTWMILSDIARHQRETCLAISLMPDHVASCSKNLEIMSKMLKGTTDELLQGASERLRDQVIVPMHRGEIKSTVMSDRLIIRLGEEWLAKASRNSLRRGNYASDRMRRAAKLLIECRKLQKVDKQQSFEDFITPEFVDTIIHASQNLSGSDGNYNMKTPSVAGKLKHDLRRLALAKELFAIKEGNNDKVKEAKAFLKVMDKEWLIKIGITESAVSQERNFNKRPELPNPTDMSKLTTFIKKKLNETVYDVETPEWKTFVDVTSWVQARLVTYNKRRPGEVETLT